MNRSRLLRGAASVALALGLGAAVPAAHAATSDDESIHLSWDGSSYTGVTTESFLGTPVAVPGDSASRTVLVRNDGPTAGVLRASIVNVELADPGAPDVHHRAGHRSPGASYAADGGQGDFYDDLVLRWSGGSASFSELHESGATAFLEVELARGREVPISLSYELPVDATSGNRSNVTTRRASFDVLLEIGEELPTAPVDPPRTAPEPAPTPSRDLSQGLPVPTGPAPEGDPPPGGQLERTGVETGVLVVLAAVAVAVGAGLAALPSRRRTATHPPGR